jgi:PelA/Pel-15E family pectate lyase
MKIKNPDQKIINSIQSAVKSFNNSKISGIRFETISAPKTDYQYHSTDEDRIVVKDPGAPPIWARFYELKTHRPLFCNRDGKPVYSLAEVERERRTGYAWYVYDPQEIFDKYPEWQLKWAPDENMLAE